MTQHRDPDILLIWGRTDANELSNEQERDWTAHTGDRGPFTASLVIGRILRLNPTGLAFGQCPVAPPSVGYPDGTPYGASSNSWVMSNERASSAISSSDGTGAGREAASRMCRSRWKSLEESRKRPGLPST